jgi:hypothetical protein
VGLGAELLCAALLARRTRLHTAASLDQSPHACITSKHVHVVLVANTLCQRHAICVLQHCMSAHTVQEQHAGKTTILAIHELNVSS